MLETGDSAFCKGTLQHCEKFQGIPDIYLINLTSMKDGQDFPYRSSGLLSKSNRISKMFSTCSVLLWLLIGRSCENASVRQNIFEFLKFP